MKAIKQSFKILSPSTPERALETLRLIEYAGRNCYRSHDKITNDSWRKFLCGLIKRGHEAPVEFGDAMVELTVGRDVLAEITRHRLPSFCVQSQRYVEDDKTGDISFIQPDFYLPAEGPDLDAKRWCASRGWDAAMENAETYYRYLRHECSVKPEDARKVLPNSTACIIVMKANLREWRHIFQLRTSNAAYPEMRSIMRPLLAEFQKLFPAIFDDITWEGKNA